MSCACGGGGLDVYDEGSFSLSTDFRDYELPAGWYIVQGWNADDTTAEIEVSERQPQSGRVLGILQGGHPPMIFRCIGPRRIRISSSGPDDTAVFYSIARYPMNRGGNCGCGG